MKIKEITDVTNKGMEIYCFEQFSSKYDNYGEVKKEIRLELDNKEVVMIDCVNSEELRIFYK